MKKTNRIYGHVFALIRHVAASRPQFTRADVPLTRSQFNTATHRLVCQGELRRTAGKRGRFGWKLAVYSKA